MQLLLTWPDTKHAFHFDENYSSAEPAVFNITLGEFSTEPSKNNGSEVLFYWTSLGPVILNTSCEYVCVIDGTFLHCGKSHSLHFTSEIQVGHFRIEVAMDAQSGSHTDELHSLLSASGMEGDNYNSCEIDDLLPHGGYHEADIRYLNERDLVRGSDSDILKELEFEYKKFLVWGEQHREFFSHSIKKENKLIQEDSNFEMVRENMKVKTLTECILESSFLFEKVWSELDVINSNDDFLYESEKFDILKELAPDNVKSKNKKTVPSLVFEDLYKIDLGSHF